MSEFDWQRYRSGVVLLEAFGKMVPHYRTIMAKVENLLEQKVVYEEATQIIRRHSEMLVSQLCDEPAAEYWLNGQQYIPMINHQRGKRSLVTKGQDGEWVYYNYWEDFPKVKAKRRMASLADHIQLISNIYNQALKKPLPKERPSALAA